MAVNKTINVKVNNNFEETAEDLNDLNDGLKQTAKASEEASESTAEMSGNLAGMNPVIGGVIGAFGKLQTGLASVGRAFFTLRRRNNCIRHWSIGLCNYISNASFQRFRGRAE